MAFNRRQCYKVFLVVLLFIAGLIIAGIIYPLLAVFCAPPTAKNEQNRLKVLWLRWFGRIIGLRVEQTGEPAQAPCLLVSNHVSWLDICIIGQLTPAHFVAKSDISGWPVIGFLARQSGTVFIRRGSKQQAKQTAERMAWLLKKRQTVCAFPEGTTTQGDHVLPFHSFLFQPALLTKAAVQPVSLEYINSAQIRAPFIGDKAFLPHLFKLLSLPQIDARIIFHPALTTAGKNRQTVSSESRACILAALADYSENDKLELKEAETIRPG